MKKIPVVLDCDPGHDDAIALLLAFSSPQLDVRGVTVTGGNQTLKKTVNNALKVLSYAGITTQVAAGCNKPLMRELTIAPQVHGESGLDGPELPEPTLKLSDKHAIDLIAAVINELGKDEKLTLIPTGPLSNIALFLLRYPELKPRIEHISLMGGAARGGNWAPSAEFNILVDPEAAKIVFESGVPITMIGLDVTHKAAIYREDIERLRNVGGKVAVMAAELLDFYSKYHVGLGHDWLPLHDPVAVAWVINPLLVTTKPCQVYIETKGRLTSGATVIQLRDFSKPEKTNALVGFDINRTAFVDLLVEAMEYYKGAA